MTPRAALVIAALAVAASGLEGQTPPARAPQTFRAATDVVIVDVSVKDGGRTITGLGAGDFVLTDNGVRQKIESVEAAAVPIDVTLVVDLSGNPRRAWVARVNAAKVASDLADEAREVTKLLRPTDRVRLLAIDRYVQQIWPLQPVSNLAPVGRVESGGLASLYDTLAAALLQPVEPARRHVVIARTKGVDTVSSIGAEALRTIASRSDALFHLVVMETALDNDAAYAGFQCGQLGLCWPTNRSWVPQQRRLVGGQPFHIVLPEGLALKAGVEATGGAWHQAVGLSEPSLTGTFRQTFENFRQSYVLRYSPQGVSRGGWHTIAVTVPKLRNATVSARKGYGVEETPPPSAPAPIPPILRTLAELTSAYERAAFQNVATALRQMTDPAQLIREFEEAGNPWPASPRREAAFAIELAEAGLFSPRAATREEAQKLLERFTRLVRHPLEPDQYERHWHYAVLTLLQGTLRPALTESFVERALARFPDDPRFLLVRAIAADQRAAVGGSLNAPVSDPAVGRALETVRQAYAALAATPEVGYEARIRLSWVLHRLGRHQEALAQLDDIGPLAVEDGSLRYLRQLFSGHVLAALDRPEDAIVLLRAAQAMAPTAQSARVALMNTLLARGDRAGAEALAERVQTERSIELDPWWMYWQGQYRLYPPAMARVRELAR